MEGTTVVRPTVLRGKRPWRDYRATFAGAGDPEKDLHIEVVGPKAGSHFAGEWTLDEAVEFATDILVEVERRRQG
jgi:hypothetical protein